MRTSFCLLAFVAYSYANAINSAIDWSRVRSQQGLGIIGGNEIKPHSAPYHVAIYIHGSTLCEGALISETVVVTSVQCVQNFTSVTVYAGAHNLFGAESSLQLKSSGNYTIHPEYNYASSTDIENDIALIFFNTPFVQDETVQPIALAPADTEDLTDTKARLTSFGITSIEADVLRPAPLTGATVDIISNKQCGKFFAPNGNLSDNLLCTLGEGKIRACTGDAGSPLEHDGVLVGIVSVNVCLPGYPIGYTRISKYADWIKKEAGL